MCPDAARSPVLAECYPVDLLQADRADGRGRPSTQPPADLVQLRPRSAVW